MIPFNLHRRIPLLRRPFYQRDTALRELADTRRALSEMEIGLGASVSQLEQGQREILAQLAGLNAASAPAAPEDDHAITFDYAYHPRPRSWAGTAGGQHIERLLRAGTATYLQEIRTFGDLVGDFARIPVAGDPDSRAPFWANDWLPALDSMTIYGLLATRNPPLYFEIGSGNSTKFARQAITDHGLRTRIISVDPHPRANIDQLCDEVIRLPCECVKPERFSEIPESSIVFADNSHRSFQNSDVTVFFTEILPSLPPGTIWGLHDILLPDDYPVEWTGRYYNEQYLLMVYLLGGAGNDRILLPNAYLSRTPALAEEIGRTLFAVPVPDGIGRRGSCFWMQRSSRQARPPA